MDSSSALFEPPAIVSADKPREAEHNEPHRADRFDAGQSPLFSPLRDYCSTPNATIIGSKISATATVENGIRELKGLEVPTLALHGFASFVGPVEDYLDPQAGKIIRWPIQGRVGKSLMEIIAAHPNQSAAVVA
jgi:hypothetical protein